MSNMGKMGKMGKTGNTDNTDNMGNTGNIGNMGNMGRQDRQDGCQVLEVVGAHNPYPLGGAGQVGGSSYLGSEVATHTLKVQGWVSVKVG
ncbi:hypothetical protein BC936DRAFT_137933 [Jimgerdemannia flammicorona]|uniref:Uncharacterized protein n=1 Tax=Jimgerdemannia flammicorona TaxID=994334 RepID=A0A433CWE0_9FUNG|nr:hypothetical protein BC936DRAFT_137933 [Jimgerdemannia flammicorona]